MSSFTLLGKAVVACILLVLVGVGVIYFLVTRGHASAPIACTAEAMQCPDGSWVGRTGPNCDFVCPPIGTISTSTATTTSRGGTTPYQSGLRGTVMAGPTCPVERNPPDLACADRPLQTLVSIFRTNDLTHAVMQVNSNASGTFEASLPPSNYMVSAGESNLPRCPQTPAIVKQGAYIAITIECDTGIR